MGRNLALLILLGAFVSIGGLRAHAAPKSLCASVKGEIRSVRISKPRRNLNATGDYTYWLTFDKVCFFGNLKAGPDELIVMHYYLDGHVVDSSEFTTRKTNYDRDSKGYVIDLVYRGYYHTEKLQLWVSKKPVHTLRALVTLPPFHDGVDLEPVEL